MGHLGELLSLLPQGSDISASRRGVLLAPLVTAVTLAMARTVAQAGRIDPTQTIIILPEAMKWVPWSGLPPHSGEMATLYDGLDQPGPYLVLMKWYPGYASAPHSYATDRLSLARLRMLAHDYPFDTVQMPLNCFDGTYRSFEQ